MFGLSESAGPPSWLLVVALAICCVIVFTMIHMQHKAELEAMEQSIKDSSKINPNFEEEFDRALPKNSGREGDNR